VARKSIQIKGIVQGVGFRPYVYKKALQYQLKGWVMNTGKGVIIDVEGSPSVLETFIKDVVHNPPSLAQIREVKVEAVAELKQYTKFEIIMSQDKDCKDALVPPDVSLCDDCKREIFDSKDRHYSYPFTNCTNCGPRFTIVKDIPYDREQTTMQEFEMCTSCKEEYGNPLNRRFHAQPVACPICGPKVELVDKQGVPIELDQGDIFKTVRRILKEGHILALKGLGGFHLACNAKDFRAIEKLRQRKRRPHKPFAAMARDLKVVKGFCKVNKEEEIAITAPSAPIVILDRLNLSDSENRESFLPDNLAPGIGTLGVMVPYTPLHFLLFDEQLDFLLMTSGNISNLPLVKDNLEALEQLGAIADYFLIHNRNIYNRCDDSLVRVINGEPSYLRRSRGAVPQALELPIEKAEVAILGTGSEMKNTFCLLKGNSAYMSQHIGELQFLEGMVNYRESLDNFAKLIDVDPAVVGYDMHPGYQVTKLAQELPMAQRIPVQHHHAHMTACMAENNLDEAVIGAILDGTGYGTDGNLWGFEIFAGNYEDFTRIAHLDYIPLPGGERAIKSPWLTAVAYLIKSLQDGRERAGRIFTDKAEELELISKMIAQNINSPLSSGCGRVFDAVSALMGVCRESSYEGQAAIELGELVIDGVLDSYSFKLNKGVISFKSLFREIVGDLEKWIDQRVIVTKFHNTIVNMVVGGVELARAQTGLSKVVLSGGTWQNEYLLLHATQALENRDFSVYSHSKVPCNDGGLALGQAVVAYRRWQKDVSSSSGKSN